MLIINILFFVVLGAVAASSGSGDESAPDDGRTRIVETSRYGTLRRKPLPQCIQDRIRNRRYFPAGDYTEEARRACERYYREHPERRPPGWKPRDEQLPVIPEETTEGPETTRDTTQEGESTNDFDTTSWHLGKGDMNILDTLGLTNEDLEACCPVDEESQTDYEDEPGTISPLYSGNGVTTSPSSSEFDSIPSKVEHGDHNQTQTMASLPSSSSEVSQYDHADDIDEEGPLCPPPTPENSPRNPMQDEAKSPEASAVAAAQGNGLV